MTDNRSDSDLHDEPPAPSHQGSGGGNLNTDMATQAELDAVGDPEVHERVTKQHAIDHDQARRSSRTPD